MMGNDEFLEINRTISNVYATPDGIFHSTGVEEDDLPDALQGGALIEVDVVHAVQMANQKGEILILQFNVPKAQNKQETEKPYENKQTVNVDGADNQMQSSKINSKFVDKANNMRSKLSVGDNIS